MVCTAVGQLCSTSNVLKNAALCRSIIARSSRAGARVVFLPEASDFIADARDMPALTQPLESSEFVRTVRSAARDEQVWVDVGVHETSDEAGRCYNTHLMIDDKGEIIQAYRKVHLFDVDIKGGATILESRTSKPGSHLLEPASTPVGRVGLLTCYDIRFPEASLHLRRLGAQVITYPSAFTLRTGAAHWETLLRARAIETQSYVVAAAQVGAHSPTRQSYGHAMIVSPWGDVIAQVSDRMPDGSRGDDEGTFVLADIDLDWLGRVRQEMPLWEQRRADIYSIP